ncbi:MAG TPA: FAD-dependent oxidoreductase [Leptolyngbyaceae cyanobacterium]
MIAYDWIAIGGGITGAALSYELTKKGFSVLLLEQQANPQNASHYNYGGLAYWSGTNELTRQLCQEGMEIHRFLSEELNIDTEFREVNLLLTIDADENPQKIASYYSQFAIPPQLLTAKEACHMEPLLNSAVISGALTVRHGHINPELVTRGYCQAMQQKGGIVQFEKVLELVRQNQRIVGVKTASETYYGQNIVVCAGGFSRQLLKASGISLPLYFTHAELIEISAVDIQLNTLVMPAQLKRFQLEKQASKSENDRLWDEPGHEPVPPILDAGAVQFKNGTIRLGQISRVLTDPDAKIDAKISESAIRDAVGKLLPSLANLPGTWHHCLVAFSQNSLPIVGTIPDVEGVHIFSSFTNPLVFVPPLARRFANQVSGVEDPIIERLNKLIG